MSNNRAFAHSRFTDKHWIVLLSAAEYLGYALNLLAAPHHWVQFTFLGCTSDVHTEIVDDRGVARRLLRVVLGGTVTRICL